MIIICCISLAQSSLIRTEKRKRQCRDFSSNSSINFKEPNECRMNNFNVKINVNRTSCCLQIRNCNFYTDWLYIEYNDSIFGSMRCMQIPKEEKHCNGWGMHPVLRHLCKHDDYKTLLNGFICCIQQPDCPGDMEPELKRKFGNRMCSS